MIKRGKGKSTEEIEFIRITQMYLQKNENESEILIQIIRTYTQDIGIEFYIEKMSDTDDKKRERKINGRNRIY